MVSGKLASVPVRVLGLALLAAVLAVAAAVLY